MPQRPADRPDDPQAAGTRLTAGFELWIARSGPDATAASLARRAPAAVLALSEAADPFARAVAAAAGVACARGGDAELDAHLEACRTSSAHALAVVAADDAWRGVLAARLGIPPAADAALRLDEGRASCLVASSHGWLLEHHNVADPGALVRREEGLGRPA